MTRMPTLRIQDVVLAGVVILAATLAAVLPVPEVHAQAQAPAEFEPRVGQAGKDVIWVPTPISLVERMLRMANVGPGDRVVDLGSGDGRIAIAAARDYKVPATGIEYNPDMVALSNRNAIEQGVANQVKFINGDIFATDFRDATVVTMYLLPNLNLRLRPILLDMKPGTRIVSHAFDMEQWQPDDVANADGQTAYLWIVPAAVSGTWRVQIGSEALDIRLNQEFQTFTGAAGPTGQLVEGTLRGEDIRMTIADGRGGRRELVGRVSGDRMTGMAGNDAFTATRGKSPAQ